MAYKCIRYREVYKFIYTQKRLFKNEYNINTIEFNQEFLKFQLYKMQRFSYRYTKSIHIVLKLIFLFKIQL